MVAWSGVCTITMCVHGDGWDGRCIASLPDSVVAWEENTPGPSFRIRTRAYMAKCGIVQLYTPPYTMHGRAGCVCPSAKCALLHHANVQDAQPMPRISSTLHHNTRYAAPRKREVVETNNSPLGNAVRYVTLGSPGAWITHGVLTLATPQALHSTNSLTNYLP